MKIETYQEKVKGSLLRGTFRPISKGNYELIDKTYYNSVWKSNFTFWDQKARTKNNYLNEILEGCFKFDLGTHYGIHSYQLVYPTINKEENK